MNETKQNVTYLYNGLSFSHKRTEVLIYTITWMNPENTVLSEEADHQKTPTYYIYIYIYTHKMSKIGKPIETESKLSSYLSNSRAQ